MTMIRAIGLQAGDKIHAVDGRTNVVAIVGRVVLPRYMDETRIRGYATVISEPEPYTLTLNYDVQDVIDLAGYPFI